MTKFSWNRLYNRFNFPALWVNDDERASMLEGCRYTIQEEVMRMGAMKVLKQDEELKLSINGRHF